MRDDGDELSAVLPPGRVLDTARVLLEASEASGAVPERDGVALAAVARIAQCAAAAAVLAGSEVSGEPSFSSSSSVASANPKSSSHLAASARDPALTLSSLLQAFDVK